MRVGGDAEGVEHRGREVAGRDRIVEHVRRPLIGLSVNRARSDARAGQHHRIARRPVLAARRTPTRRLLDRHQRRTPELAHAHHQRLLQQTALVHVFEQCRERSIEARQQVVLHVLEDVVVRVPAVVIGFADVEVLAANVVVAEHRDPRHSGFHQPPAHEARLPRTEPAVAVAHLRRFPFQIEGIPHPRRVHQFIRLERQRRGGEAPIRPRRGLDSVQEFAAIAEALRRQIDVRVQHGKQGRAVDDVAEVEGIVSAAEDAAVLAGARFARREQRAVHVKRRVRETPVRPHPMQQRTQSRRIGSPRRRVRSLPLMKLTRQR